MLSNFEQVASMNRAFGNMQGDPSNIDWTRVRSQSINILDEFIELMRGLGASEEILQKLLDVRAQITADVFTGDPDLEKTRDALCDVNVFSYGTHHLMGIDANLDMMSVVNAVMTRFIKNDADKEATIAMHSAKGVTDVYFEGDYPAMIMKSACDQPDAPKGKFLKSASYTEPSFYPVPEYARKVA